MAMWLWIGVGSVMFLLLLLLSDTVFRLTTYGIFVVPTYLLLRSVDRIASLTPLLLLKISGVIFCVSISSAWCAAHGAFGADWISGLTAEADTTSNG